MLNTCPKSNCSSCEKHSAACAQVWEVLEHCNSRCGEVAQFWLCSSTTMAKRLGIKTSPFLSWVFNREHVKLGSDKTLFMVSLNYPWQSYANRWYDEIWGDEKQVCRLHWTVVPAPVSTLAAVTYWWSVILHKHCTSYSHWSTTKMDWLFFQFFMIQLTLVKA